MYLLISENRLYLPTDIREPAFIYPLISENQPIITFWYQSTHLYWPTDIRVPASVYLISEYQSVPFFGFCFVSSCLLISSFSFSWENQTLTGNIWGNTHLHMSRVTDPLRYSWSGSVTLDVWRLGNTIFNVLVCRLKL